MGDAGGKMLGEISTMTGYVRAPKTTYVVKHPIRAMRMARVRRDLEEALTPGRIALGLGVLAAIPAGIWFARRYRDWRQANAEVEA